MNGIIEATVIDNMQKYENYREQFKRLNKAFDYKFYMEAIFIEYAIMEDRAEAILRYEGNEIRPKNEHEFISITRKLSKIEKIAEQKKSLPEKYFSDGIVKNISEWVKQRNSLIHALLKKELTTEDVEIFALEGKRLARELSNKAKNYKSAVARKEAKK